MLSFIFFCGIFACCVSGLFTAHRYGYSLNGARCAYERIYYDLKNGQLKLDSPRFDGLNQIETYLTELSKLLN